MDHPGCRSYLRLGPGVGPGSPSCGRSWARASVCQAPAFRRINRPGTSDAGLRSTTIVCVSDGRTRSGRSSAGPARDVASTIGLATQL